MDSEVQRDGRILDLIDDAWREDKLPYEDVAIPLVGCNVCSFTAPREIGNLRRGGYRVLLGA